MRIRNKILTAFAVVSVATPFAVGFANDSQDYGEFTATIINTRRDLYEAVVETTKGDIVLHVDDLKRAYMHGDTVERALSPGDKIEVKYVRDNGNLVSVENLTDEEVAKVRNDSTRSHIDDMVEEKIISGTVTGKFGNEKEFGGVVIDGKPYTEEEFGDAFRDFGASLEELEIGDAVVGKYLLTAEDFDDLSITEFTNLSR